MINNYKKWSNWLIKNGFSELLNKSIFELHKDKITFLSTCSFSEEFIRERYFMLFSDQEITEISKKIKKDFFSKRPSQYDLESIVKKLSVSYQEAELIVKERKQRTSGSLNSFIERHGEKEGKEKFEVFRQKSSHTREKYIEKYGEKEGIKKWDIYIKTKGKSKKDYLKEFGLIEGEKKWEEIQKKRKIGSSKTGIIAKYGKKYYDDLMKEKKFKNSLEGYIEKYGAAVGAEKWKDLNTRKDSKSFEAILKANNNDHELAKKIYEKKNMLSSPIYVELKKLYGEELAEKKYKENSKKHFDLELPIHKSKPHLKSKKGCISSESKLFFEKLEIILGRKLKFGNKKKELKLFNEEFLEIYYYDCFDPVSNVIVEFNGVAYHPREDQKDFFNVASNKNYEQSFVKDQRKIDFAKSLGYIVHIVWSDEVRRKHEKNEKLNCLAKKWVQNEN
jgi:hypothetical protein